MRVALVSTGLGRVLRGFESFTESLFHALRSQVPGMDVILFQGGGKPDERRVVVPNLHRYDAPARWLGYYKGNQLEKRTFAMALYPVLRLGRFDLVHYNEVVMGSALFHLRRHFGGRFRLLYCDGGLAMPCHYHHRCDFAQTLTPAAYEDATAFGISSTRLFLLPYGVDSDRFSPDCRSGRTEARKKLGIPDNARVVLTIAALDRKTKRLDYLIREVSQLNETVWLVAAGQRTEDTRSLEQEAERLMPGRWRFVSWPQADIPALYGAADQFVLASLKEGFGLVTVEAMLSGLPVAIHNGPVFQWVAKDTSAQLLDMSVEGNLARALQQGLSSRTDAGSRARAAERFSWNSLVPEYLKMYERVCA